MSRPEKFWSLNIVIWDLFEIWCLEFVILDTKLQGEAIYLWLGLEDQVFQDKIKKLSSSIVTLIFKLPLIYYVIIKFPQN